MIYPEFFTKDHRKKESEAVITKKVETVISEMTLEEKLSFCHGANNPTDRGQIANAGYMPGLPRLGIPEIRMYDGPSGVTSIYDTTGMPCQEVLASCWSEEEAYRYGSVMGRENVSVSGNFQLGAQFDIVRIPHFGRTRDMLGEDPTLAASLAVAETKGIQDQGAIATLKHFAGYGQSANPVFSADFRIDEQTLHEAYLRPFEAACKEGEAGSIMCTYNKINGKWAASSPYLHKTVIRDLWGFKGCVMSDWGATHRFCTHLGMDIEMPVGMYNRDSRILKALEDGEVSVEEIDTVCRHVLYGLASCGYLSLVQLSEDRKVVEDVGRTEPIKLPFLYEEDVASGMLEEDAQQSYTVAAKGITLLKNEGMLPLREEDDVAVIGLGGTHLISGCEQERAFGRICRMVSPADALKTQLPKVSAFVAMDIVGTAIPGEVLYQDKECTKQGLVRTYGILPEDGACPSIFGPGGAGQAFDATTFAPDDDCDLSEEQFSLGPPVGDANAAAEMEGRITGTLASIDENVNFTCGTIDGKVNQTYKNSYDGTAFENGAAYTWKGYLKAPETGTYTLAMEAIGGQTAFRIALDGENYEFVGNTNTREGSHWAWGNVVPTPEGMDIESRELFLEAGKVYPVILYGRAMLPHKDLQMRAAWITPSQKKKDYADAVEAAGQHKKVLLFVNGNKAAESDMQNFTISLSSLELPEEQKQLLKDVSSAAAAAGNQLCVCVNGSIPVTMGRWADSVDAILQLWLPGQEGGRAVADILTGKVNPSGKLAQSLPARDEDTLVTDSEEHRIRRHDGYADADNKLAVDFEEGIFFGYRWFDEEGKKALFPFGHGLSYTTFAYSDLEINGREVTFTVTNTGSVAGTEIAQVYLGEIAVPAGIQMAKKQLCSFARIEDLQPGESATVTLSIPWRNLCYWDPKEPYHLRSDGTMDKWILAKGERTVYVGSSSENLILSAPLMVE